MTPQPEIRIGDAEREAAVAALGDHYAAGRLTKEEYDERAGIAWSAKTNSALWPLFVDLPRPQAGPRPVYSTAQERPRSGHRPGHRPGWVTFGLAPVLMAMIAIAVITHLPVLVLVGVLWLLWARSTHPARRAQRWEHRQDWDHWNRR
jgi:Flp pilus assembly protein TadB